MLDLSSHVSRHPMKCPVQTRAISGANAAHRLNSVKRAKDRDLSLYHEIETLCRDAGHNLEAILLGSKEMPGPLRQARSLMARRWAEYDRAVRAEHIVINLERAA